MKKILFATPTTSYLTTPLPPFTIRPNFLSSFYVVSCCPSPWPIIKKGITLWGYDDVSVLDSLFWFGSKLWCPLLILIPTLCLWSHGWLNGDGGASVAVKEVAQMAVKLCHVPDVNDGVDEWVADEEDGGCGAHVECRHGGGIAGVEHCQNGDNR